MPDLPEEAVQAAASAVSRMLFSGQPEYGTWMEHDEDLARAAVEAAAPFIAAQALIQERRRAVRLVRRTLVQRGCEPTKDAADLIDAIKGDLYV